MLPTVRLPRLLTVIDQVDCCSACHSHDSSSDMYSASAGNLEPAMNMLQKLMVHAQPAADTQWHH